MTSYDFEVRLSFESAVSDMEAREVPLLTVEDITPGNFAYPTLISAINFLRAGARNVALRFETFNKEKDFQEEAWSLTKVFFEGMLEESVKLLPGELIHQEFDDKRHVIKFTRSFN